MTIQSHHLIYILLGMGCSFGLVGIAFLVWMNHGRHQQIQLIQALKEDTTERLGHLSQLLERRLGETLLQQSHLSGEMHRNFSEILARHSNDTAVWFKDLNLQLEKRLHEGFERTTATFSDIVKRLALIDDAQKKLTELSSNVVSLQEILVDKRSRGAFGEIQLQNLIQNMLPPDNYAFQHTLSNGMRADCILFLPEPTGHVVIDSKFPLENFQIMTDFASDEALRKKASQTFRQDIKKHINDIASKYIISLETCEGAILFIPAEAVFAEIHAHFPDLVAFAQRVNVWLASPTTLMAILTTARAVLKDSATRQHIHVIQEHLRALAGDFSRFEIRMQNLSKHINQAQKDVQQVHTSAKKITNRFTQIDKCEIGQLSASPSSVEEDPSESSESNVISFNTCQLETDA
jgi:DNA recombination protein RmuC